MNFNTQIAEAFKMFISVLGQSSQPKAQNFNQFSGMSMNESIFGAGFNQKGVDLQNTGLTDDMLMQAFGIQKSENNNGSIISPQEQKDLELYKKTLGEDDGERYDALMEDAQNAKTKAEINQVISAITKENAKYQGLSSGIKEYDGLKKIIEERTNNFETELETLNSKLSAIKSDEEE